MRPTLRTVVVFALGVLTFGIWIPAVALASTFGLYSYQVLNASGISAWGIGAAFGTIVLIVKERTEASKAPGSPR
mgnify:CR=1 FL=1